MKKLLIALGLAAVLSLGLVNTAFAQDDQEPAIQEDTDDGFDWGWLGLLGLIGLAGLSGRKRDATVVHTDATRRNP